MQLKSTQELLNKLFLCFFSSSEMGIFLRAGVDIVIIWFKYEQKASWTRDRSALPHSRHGCSHVDLQNPHVR